MYRPQDHPEVMLYFCSKNPNQPCHQSMPSFPEKPGVQEGDAKSNSFILLCSGKASNRPPKAQEEPGAMEKSSEEIARKVKNLTCWEDWKRWVAALGEKRTGERRCCSGLACYRERTIARLEGTAPTDAGCSLTQGHLCSSRAVCLT